MKLGYLVAQYPALSHTYILGEVVTLRRHGVEVYTVSVRRCDRPRQMLTSEEAEEEGRTFSVIGAGSAHALWVNLKVLIRRPARYLRGLFYAWSLTRGTPRLLFPYTMYFLEAIVAGNYFESHGVGSIHTHFSSSVALILSRIFPIRYSMTLHGSGEFVDVVGFHVAQKVAAAQFVATVSLYGRSQVMNASDPIHWHKVITLPLGVDTNRFSPAPSRTRVGDAAFNVISVGRLAEAKGYPLLIEAVGLLRARGRNVTLTLIGDGPVRPDLEKYIGHLGLQEHVLLAGARSSEQVVQFYREADVFALSSFLEGVPVVLMEAMAMQLPCIATWITGIPEIIEAEVDGLLVPPASAQHLADAIARLIDDPELARRIGAAGRRKVLSKYQRDQNVAHLASTFEEHWASQPQQAQ